MSSAYVVGLVLRGRDTWRIDDEWWRERPVSRLYFEVALEDGQVATVYRDLLQASWWQQRF